METYRKMMPMEKTRSIDILKEVKVLSKRLDKGWGEEGIKDNFKVTGWMKLRKLRQIKIRKLVMKDSIQRENMIVLKLDS